MKTLVGFALLIGATMRWVVGADDWGFFIALVLINILLWMPED